MSQENKSATEPQQAKAAAQPQAGGDAGLERLMREGKAPDLEHQALAAAEQALAQGQQALSEARSYLDGARPPAPPSRKRELALRALLAVNLLAMAIVLLLPGPAATDATTTAPVDPGAHPAPPTGEQAPTVRTPSLDDPVIRAFAAADRRDYRSAIALLEGHLAATPRLAPARKANILLALEHYAAQLGDFVKAQEYQRKAEALQASHSLPEDLVQMALEAERNGDVESMRRCYARLLLQQRQIPSGMFRRVAEAYLKLGDSYRQEAEQAALKARERELAELQEKLRQHAATDRKEEPR